MKLVREYINEKFTEDSDPVKDMNIGEMNRIHKELKELGIPAVDVEIDDNFEIYYKRGFHKPRGLIDLQIEHLSAEKQEFVKKILGLQKTNFSSSDIETFDIYIKEAVDNGISADDIKKLIIEFGNDQQKSNYTIPLSKYTRTKKETKEDEKNNIYVFIGYTEKTPVTVNGKKYYEDKFEVEKLVKIERFNRGDLQMVSMMKLRARVQYGSEASVYMIYVPKSMMNKESYDGIPEEYRYIIEENKKKIN